MNSVSTVRGRPGAGDLAALLGHARPDDVRPSELASRLGSDLGGGLGSADAADRLASHGPNRLDEARPTRWFVRFVRQLAEPMAVLLILAALVSSIGLGELVQGIAIAVIVGLNATVAVVQEGRAARALDALSEMESPHTTVLRDGRRTTIAATDVVVGDVVVVTAGDRIPADLRIAESSAAEADESLVTGESTTVWKDATAQSVPDAGVGDRHGMLFAGTVLTRGSARGIAVATGMDTELGSIAGRLRAPRPRTPLQRDLAHLSSMIGVLAAVVAAGVFALLVAQSGAEAGTVQRAFLVGVALAVAAVPEGLPAVTTIALAVGVRRMARQGAIVRRLPAVETLGVTSVLAADKTGTLTENRMQVEWVVLADGAVSDPSELSDPIRDAVGEIACLCSDSEVEPPSGDPLEIALMSVVSAGEVAELRRNLPRIGEKPFDADARRMVTLHQSSTGTLLLMKGAAEEVVPRCSTAIDGRGAEVSLPDPAEVLDLTSGLAAGGMRTLALARRTLIGAAPPGGPAMERFIDGQEHDLQFVALVGLRDPIRPEAAGSIASAQGAGIDVVMVTGDHPATAEQIGREVGLLDAGQEAVTGAQVAAGGLPSDPLSHRVYARVDPAQKLEIVHALQARGHVVSVTGDGVNDAPALQSADIGVALGRRGSDVAVEAADMVITDDNLGTIVRAVREGRGIYANIRTVVDYLVSCNVSEIAVVLAGLLLVPAIGVPLLPLQLLWMNLVTDGLPALALGAEPIKDSVMRQRPRPRGERMLGARALSSVAARALVMAVPALGALAFVRSLGADWDRARTVLFTVLVVVQLLYVFPARAWRRPALAGMRARMRSAIDNPRLIGAVAVGMLLQVLAVSFAPARSVLGTTPLEAVDWSIVFAASIVPVVVLSAWLRVRGAATRRDSSDTKGKP